MKTIGISDKEKQLIFTVLSILLLLGVYFLGFTKIMDQAKAIENSNKQDQATVNELQAMYDKQDEKKAETAQYKQTIRDIVKKYPTKVPQEKAIWIIQKMEDEIGLHIDSINFSLDNVMMDFSGSDAPTGYYNIMGMHFTASYDQWKQMLKFIRDYEDRSTAPSVSVEYDQIFGYLSGTINYRMYYLTKTESEFDDRTYDDSFKVDPPLPLESGVAEMGGIFGMLMEFDNEEDGTSYLARLYFVPETDEDQIPLE